MASDGESFDVEDDFEEEPDYDEEGEDDEQIVDGTLPHDAYSSAAASIWIVCRISLATEESMLNYGRPIQLMRRTWTRALRADQARDIWSSQLLSEIYLISTKYWALHQLVGL